MQDVGEHPRKSRAVIVRTVIAIVLGAWLCWQAAAAGIAALAERSADARLLAATGSARYPEVGSLLAQGMLVGGDATGAAQLARSVVLADPLNDRALRVLGLANEALGRRDAGAAIMRQAGALGWRDTPTQLWLLRDAAQRDDYATLIDRADALARRNRSGELTQGIFLAAMTEPHLRRALVDSLGRQPMWRGAFFANVRQRLPATSVASMETLFRDMQAGGQTVGPIEWLSFVDRLVDLGDYRRARDVWARAFAIPASRLAASPYDGNFALAAARAADAPVSQFEWAVNADLVGAVTFGTDTGGSALAMPSDVASGTTVVSQVLTLPAGQHTLSARLEPGSNAASAAWTVTCLPSKQELPRRLPHGTNDELTAIAFEVPATQCGAQRLVLTARDHMDAQGAVISRVEIR